MKKSLIRSVCVILISSNSLSCQNIVSARDLDSICSQFALEIKVSFNFGSGATCPPLKSASMSVLNGKAHLELYYDVSGAWPALFCERTDTLYSTAPPTIDSIMIHVNTVNGSTVTSANSYSTLAFCVSNKTALGEFDRLSISLAPNPAHGCVFLKGNNELVKEVEISDLTGKMVLQVPVENQRIDIRQLRPGLYFLKCQTAKKTIAIKLLVSDQ
jgi:hypothetical protein